MQIELPCLALTIAPFKSGKTTLLKHFVLKHSKKWKAVILFGTTVRTAYDKEYSWLNKRYTSDEFNEDKLREVMKLGKKIKQATNGEGHILLAFDDPIGLDDSLFEKKENKKILTTLRHYNIDMWICTHRLQNEVTTLTRNNATDVFLYRNAEPNGIKLMYETWGRSSTNLHDKNDFTYAVQSLKKFEFMHYNTERRSWSKNKLEAPVPPFRLYLHPDDKKITDMPVVYGNKENFNLKSIEEEDTIEEVDSGGEQDIYLSKKEIENEDEESEEDDEDKPVEAVFDEIMEDYDEENGIKPSKEEKTKSKKKKEPKSKNKTKGLESPEETLLDMVEEGNQFTQDLDKRSMLLMHRLRAQLLYIKTAPNNPDKIILDNRVPGFLNQDFNNMPLQALRENWLLWRTLRNEEAIIASKHGLFNVVEIAAYKLATQIAGTEYINKAPISAIFDPIRHESILDSLGKTNPYSAVRSLTAWERLFSAAGPVTKVLYELHSDRNEKERIGTNLGQPLAPDDVNNYLKMME